MRKTIFVAVDGFDGSGKTSLIRNLSHLYSNDHISTFTERLLPLSVNLFKRYTNGTNDYMRILPDKYRVSVYLWESYFRLNILISEYNKYDIVFFDRWIYTNLIDDIDFKEESAFIDFLINSIPAPDILLLIQTSPDNVIQRLTHKKDWMLTEYSLDYIKKQITPFYSGYVTQLKKHSINYAIIDGNQPLYDVTRIAYSIINNYQQCG